MIARKISRKQYILPFHTSGRRHIQGGREMATEGGIKRLTGGFASSLGALAGLNTRCSFRAEELAGDVKDELSQYAEFTDKTQIID